MNRTQELGKLISRFLPIVFLFLIAFSLTPGCAQPKTVVHNLSEPEANEIIVFLDRKGIKATKTAAATAGGGGQGEPVYNITVSSQDYETALALLNVHGLPRRRGADLLGLFSQGGLVPSPMEEQVKYQEGLAEKIAGTIRLVDGVLDARVQLSLPEEDTLNPNAVPKEKTASVYVKHQGVLDDPNSQLVTKIKRLVASSIEGLKFENVTVIADKARFIGDPSEIREERLEEKQWVKIWGVVIATESVTRFRTTFLGMVAIMVLCILFSLWMVFKVLPVLSRTGGVGQLFSTQPIDINALLPEEDGEGKKKGGEKESEESEEVPEGESEEEERPEV